MVSAVVVQATSAAGSAVGASFVKVTRFLLPYSWGVLWWKMTSDTPFLQRMYSPGPTLRKYLCRNKGNRQDPVVGEEPLFSKHFIRPIIFNAWTNGQICYTPISQGGRNLPWSVIQHRILELPMLTLSFSPYLGSGACKTLPSPADACS